LDLTIFSVAAQLESELKKYAHQRTGIPMSHSIVEGDDVIKRALRLSLTTLVILAAVMALLWWISPTKQFQKRVKSGLWVLQEIQNRPTFRDMDKKICRNPETLRKLF